MKHDPDHGPAAPSVVSTGELAGAYAQLSACISAFTIWVMGTLVLPEEVGQRLHLHVLAGPMMYELVHSPWTSSRSAEIFENTFYKDRGAVHTASSQVLSTLMLWRWRSTILWRKWGATSQSGSNSMHRALQGSSTPPPFPVVPMQLATYKSGVLWVRLQRQLSPLMQKWDLEWVQVGTSEAVWVPMPRHRDLSDGTYQAIAQYGLQCANTLKEQLKPTTVMVGAPRSGGRVQSTMPQIAEMVPQAGHPEEGMHLCGMLAAVLSTTQPTRLASVYPQSALQVQSTAPAQPTTMEDIIEDRVLASVASEVVCMCPDWCMGAAALSYLWPTLSAF